MVNKKLSIPASMDMYYKDNLSENAFPMDNG